MKCWLQCTVLVLGVVQYVCTYSNYVLYIMYWLYASCPSPTSIAFSDYVGGPYVVDFPANETTVRLQIAIMDDTERCECSEDFTASLEVPAAAGQLGVVPGVNDTAEIIIIDDDCELILRMQQ